MAEIKLKIASVVIGSGEGGGSGVAPYYADLPDKPSINGETLSGNMSSEDLGLASAGQSVPSGGTTGQVLAKKSNADNDVQWVNQQSGGQGTTNYADLDNKPKINNVTLSGNKTTSQLGLQSELVSGTNIKTINGESLLGSGNITIEGGGTDDYADLDNKPQINSVSLSGNKSASDLGLATAAQGAKADTAVQQVTVGTTTTGNAGTNASVTNSGTSTAPVLDFTIPRGADAVNPFKGWYDAITSGTHGVDFQVTDEDGNLPSNPVLGDYAYVKTWDIDTTQSPQEETTITKIYECTTTGSWSDSGRTADTSNVQTFASNQEVNETYIDDTNLANPVAGSLAKAEDVRDKILTTKNVNDEFEVHADKNPSAAIINSSNKWVTGWLVYPPVFLKVTPGETLLLSKIEDPDNPGTNLTSGWFAFLKDLDNIEVTTPATTPHFSEQSGFTGRFSIGSLTTENSALVVVPSDANYLYRQTHYNSGNYYNDICRLVWIKELVLFKTGQQLKDVSIIDDLETGGSNNVLSAEQGKTLFQSHYQDKDDLNQDINCVKVDTDGSVIISNLTDIMTFTDDWVVNCNPDSANKGKVNSYVGGYKATKGFICIKDFIGKKLRISLPSYKSNLGVQSTVGLAFYNTNSEGTSGFVEQIVPLPLSATSGIHKNIYEVTIQPNWNYLRTTYLKDDTSVGPFVAEIIEPVKLGVFQEQLGVVGELLPFSLIANKTVCCVSDWSTHSLGEIVDTTGHHVTNYIDVEGLKALYFVGAKYKYNLSSLHIGFCFYDEEYNVVKATVWYKDQPETGELAYGNYFVPVPSGAKYFVADTRDADTTELFFVRGISSDKDVAYFIDELFKNSSKNQDINDLLMGDNNYAPILKNAKYLNFKRSVGSFNMIHFSDIHNDGVALARIVAFKQKYSTYIDDILHTGDTVWTKWESGVSFWDAVSGSESILNCLGNHDTASPSGGVHWGDKTAAECRARYIDPYISNWGNVTIGNGVCYYYKDYATYNLRLIVIDLYHPQSKDPYVEDPTQLSWLENTLADARTNGLHVILAGHSPEAEYGSHLDTAFDNLNYADNYEMSSNWPCISDNIIGLVSDFIDAGGVFVCYLCGHMHADIMRKFNGHNNMLSVAVQTASVREHISGATESTGPNGTTDRVIGERSEDCFNIVSVDTENKILSIIRIGQDFDLHGRHLGSVTYDYNANKIISEW